MPGKKNSNQKETITPENHDSNVGQRGGTGATHSEEPNTGMPLTGNKNQGDDLESIIPGKDRPTRDDGDNDDKGSLK